MTTSGQPARPTRPPGETLLGEPLLRAMVDQSPDFMMVVGSDLRIQYINRAGDGWNAQDIIGVDVTSLVAKSDARLVRERYEAARRERRPTSFEISAIGADGVVRWFAVRVAPILNTDPTSSEVASFVVTSRDVTNRRDAEHRSSERERFIRSITDAAPVLIYVYDIPNQANTYVNASVSAILGYSHDEWKAMSAGIIQRLVHPDDLVHWPAHIEQRLKAKDGDILEFEYRVRHKQGHYVTLFCRESVWRRGVHGVPIEVLGTAVDVTKQHQAERDAAEKERFIQKVADSAPILIYIYDLNKRAAAYVNPAIHRILGYTTDQILAASENLFPSYMHPEDLAKYPAYATRLSSAKDGDVLQFNFRALHRDGHWVSLSSRDMVWARDERGQPTHVIGTAMDVTRERHAEEELRQSEARYRAVVEDQSELIRRYRPDGTVTFVNSALCRFFDRKPEQIVGHSFLEYLRPQERAAVTAYMDRVAREGQATHEQRIVAPDGRHRWVQWSDRCVLTREGHPVEFLGVGRDVSAQRAAEELLKERDAQLRQSQKMEAVGILASGVAHDFNNLLTAIRSYASLARSTLREGHPALESLDNVEEASRQASGVAGALLTFAKRGSSKKSPVAIAPIIESSLRLFRRTIPAAVSVTIDLSKAQDLWVEADANQLQQVVMNLALNARDAIRGSGLIHVSVEPGPMLPNAAGEQPVDPKGSVRIIVKDNGEGMTPDVKAHLFEPFFTTKRKEQGSGLGLAVVHGIVTEHGGRIDVQSERNQGSTFIVSLPRALPPKEPDNPRAASVPPIGSGNLALVVEPQPLIRGLIASMLTSLGFDVIHAANPEQALAEITKPARVIDVLVAPQALGSPPILDQARAKGWNGPAVIIAGDPSQPPSRDPHVAFLHRPFQITDLKRALAVLDRSKS